MNELSVFIDESGDTGSGSDYYLLTLVLHNQAVDIEPSITRYLREMQNATLETETFHFTPLIRGHAPFDAVDFKTRKKRFAIFRVFAEQTRFRYLTFVYSKREYADGASLEKTMRRDMRLSIQDNLAFFQSFDAVKIYYDNGQSIVRRAIHSAFEQALFKEAIVYRDISPADYFLFQVADYVCGIELTAIRYKTNKAGKTEARFFGEWINFKKNYLKNIRRKRM